MPEKISDDEIDKLEAQTRRFASFLRKANLLPKDSQEDLLFKFYDADEMVSIAKFDKANNVYDKTAAYEITGAEYRNALIKYKAMGSYSRMETNARALIAEATKQNNAEALQLGKDKLADALEAQKLINKEYFGNEIRPAKGDPSWVDAQAKFEKYTHIIKGEALTRPVVLAAPAAQLKATPASNTGTGTPATPVVKPDKSVPIPAGTGGSGKSNDSDIDVDAEMAVLMEGSAAAVATGNTARPGVPDSLRSALEGVELNLSGVTHNTPATTVPKTNVASTGTGKKSFVAA